MDGCVATVAVHLRRKQRIEVIAQWALVLGLLDEEDAIIVQGRHNIPVAFATCRTVTSSVQVIQYAV